MTSSKMNFDQIKDTTNGYTDIHCHGGGGFSFSDPNLDNVRKAIAMHRSHGTTRLMASLVTEPIDVLIQQINRLSPLVDSGEFMGIHLEGPYLSHAKCGAHDPALLRYPDLNEIQSLIEAGQGNILMVTIAPELPGALETIELMVKNDITVAIGHSAATYDQAIAAMNAGATVATHFYNGMPKFNEAEHSITHAVLEDPRVQLELILDGHHLSDEIVKIVIEKANDRIILITDAMAAAGSADGNYKIGDLEVVVKGGAARLVSNGSLAGSTLTLDRAHELLLKITGASGRD